MKRPAALAALFLALAPSLPAQLTPGPAWRSFKEADSDRIVEARVAGKKADNSQVRLVLRNGRSMWVDVARFSEDDIAYIKAWEKVDIRLRANTVSTAARRSEWSETWGNFDASGAEIIHGGVSSDFRSRVVGVTIENNGTVEDLVMEFFWLGFPLDNKTKRVINALAAKKIKVPAGERHTIRVGSTYRYTDTSLVYLAADQAMYNWRGYYFRTWIGYTYAGWAVRISDGKGAVIDQAAAQPSFLSHIALVPLPLEKTP